MDEFILIKVMNEARQRSLKDKGENTEKNDKIEEFLKDEAFFYKISKQNAFKILICVGVIKEELERVYRKLVCPFVYYKLIRENKLNPKDKAIRIKFQLNKRSIL